MTITQDQIDRTREIHAKLVAGANKRRAQRNLRLVRGFAPVALALGAAIVVAGLPKAES